METGVTSAVNDVDNSKHLVVYDSRGGTTRGVAKRIADTLGVKSMDCKEIVKGIKKLREDTKYIFLTYTDKIGELPKSSEEFLENNEKGLVGVVGNGSSDFKKMGVFAQAGDIVADRYRVPLIKKLDRGGTAEDIEDISETTADLMGIDVKVKVEKEESFQLAGIIQLKRL